MTSNTGCVIKYTYTRTYLSQPIVQATLGIKLIEPIINNSIGITTVNQDEIGRYGGIIELWIEVYLFTTISVYIRYDS